MQEFSISFNLRHTNYVVKKGPIFNPCYSRIVGICENVCDFKILMYIALNIILINGQLVNYVVKGGSHMHNV